MLAGVEDDGEERSELAEAPDRHLDLAKVVDCLMKMTECGLRNNGTLVLRRNFELSLLGHEIFVLMMVEVFLRPCLNLDK